MTTPAPPAAKKSGGKILGMKSSTFLIVLGGAALLGIGWYLWKQHEAAKTVTSASTVTSAETGATDYAGELSVIQTELESLLAAQANSGSGTGTGTSTGTSTKTTTSTGTTTKTSTKTTAPAKVPAMPANVKASKTTTTTTTLTWTASPGATSYNIRVTYQDKLVRSGTASGTSRVVNGLSPDHTYTMHVAACNSAGCSSETNGPTVKTPA
jgi:hypothetical protein